MLYPALAAYLQTLPPIDQVADEERKEKLRKVSQFIREALESEASVPLIFICTHNSRRSHMGQIWAQVFALMKGISVSTYSGGTEATAFNPNAIAALQKAGMRIEGSPPEENPRYRVQVGEGITIENIFSKTFGDAFNPQSGFAAIMTCTDADEACPFVPGAQKRFSLPYADPKAFDGSPQQDEKYEERSRHIASEMRFLMENV